MTRTYTASQDGQDRERGRPRGAVRRAIDAYLRTGSADPLYSAWPGDIISRCTAGSAEIKEALVSAVTHRAGHRPPPAQVPSASLRSLTSQRLAPMVHGLFPAAERGVVLDLLVRGVVFCTAENIRQVLLEQPWPETSWNIANLYLESLGARPLSRHAPRIVGLCEGTNCYVSTEYFSTASRFDDFILHEAAHVFHNCKRRTAGFPETRRCEWLLDVAFAKRETFAWACEAFGCIARLAPRASERRELVEEWGRTSRPSDPRVDPLEITDILQEAVAERNGWKRILARCAPCPGVDRSL